MAESARRGGPALESAYQFILWLVPTVEKFPRSQKFLLGDRIQATALDVLERLIEATYSRQRAGMLDAANLAIEKLRFMFRIATDLRYIDVRRYEHAARGLKEKSLRARFSSMSAETARHLAIAAVADYSRPSSAVAILLEGRGRGS